MQCDWFICKFEYDPPLMKKLIFSLLIVCGFVANAQTPPDASVTETMDWLNKKLTNGLGVARAEFKDKTCGLCFYTKTGVTGTCVHLGNIDPDQIVAGDNGSGGRRYYFVAKAGLHAATSTNKNGVATNVDKYNFELRPEAITPTLDQEMIDALKRLVRNCSK